MLENEHVGSVLLKVGRWLQWCWKRNRKLR